MNVAVIVLQRSRYRALANYSMNVQSIFIYLFSSEFIYFNITAASR